MKLTVKLILGMATMGSSQAATITLISAGNNGGGDVAVLNGSFESGTTDAASGTDDWTDLSGNDTSIRNINGVSIPDGSYRGVILSLAGSERTPAVDTGYQIQTGDTFSLSFLSGGAANWDTPVGPGAARMDTLATLYTSAGDIESFVVTPDFYVNSSPGTYSLSGTLLANASAGSVGNNLQLRFEVWNPNTNSVATTSSAFTVVDDVFLEVTSVPEPSSTALLGLGGLALILRRRR